MSAAVLVQGGAPVEWWSCAVSRSRGTLQLSVLILLCGGVIAALGLLCQLMPKLLSGLLAEAERAALGVWQLVRRHLGFWSRTGAGRKANTARSGKDRVCIYHANFCGWNPASSVGMHMIGNQLLGLKVTFVWAVLYTSLHYWKKYIFACKTRLLPNRLWPAVVQFLRFHGDGMDVSVQSPTENRQIEHTNISNKYLGKKWVHQN